MPSERLNKVNDLIRDEVGKIVSSEMDFDDILVTVVAADVSHTLEHANIHISVFPETKAHGVLKVLKQNIYDIQQVLNKKVVMRPVPKIRFVLDSTEEKAAQIEKLIDSVINKETAQ